MKSIIPLAIIGVCIGMYFMYISPSISKFSEKRAKVTEYENVINKVKEIKDKKDELDSKFSNITPEDLDRLNKLIPEKFDSVLFANDLNSMALRYGMKIKQIKLNYEQPGSNVTSNTEVGNKPFTVITGNFGLSGSYDQFLSFLKDLESSLRLIDVINLSIKSSGGERAGISALLEYSIEIRTYSLK